MNIPKECDGKTLLATLCAVVRHVPAAQWQSECARGLVLDANGEPALAARVVRAGERFRHKFPNVTEPDVNARVEILHEDEALIVLNKPAPLPMHSGGRFYRNTLQYILNAAYHPQKPHPGHRLDANTTGVVLVTRTRHFAGRLQPQFTRGEVEKLYLARVRGHPPQDAFFCDAPIAAKSVELGSRNVNFEAGLSARTEFRVLRRTADGTALLEVRPLTGRTNQIRVHLWHLGFPVCGDMVYLPDKKKGDTQTLAVTDPPLYLHAWKIRFAHPLSGERMEFEAETPGYWECGEFTFSEGKKG